MGLKMKPEHTAAPEDPIRALRSMVISEHALATAQ